MLCYMLNGISFYINIRRLIYEAIICVNFFENYLEVCPPGHISKHTTSKKRINCIAYNHINTIEIYIHKRQSRKYLREKTYKSDTSKSFGNYFL